ncbi:hypothetical protein [Chryseosolibacter indicus]|uniref:Uncharacterized protein n=1 Tax=Chryseosolibacter indicus TaxID=2782351 RepID=A0ABS5VVS9_9BACT|nr:hypothetical protein [Chryseosolibacter indicus]MBT1704917.1 hypothetical protein [Chryseosolibacter indicus]
MGVVKNNLVTKGFSGKMGDDIVFRQVGNQTQFAKAGRRRASFTENQVAQQERFLNAVMYAKSALLDPATKELYVLMAEKAGLRSAYSAAVTDYLTPPKIASVFTGNYQGEVGNTLFIAAVNDFKITEVTLTIQRADNTVVETGAALRDGGSWKYTAAVANAEFMGNKIVVRAKDRLGKEVTFEQLLGT